MKTYISYCTPEELIVNEFNKAESSKFENFRDFVFFVP